MNLKRFLTMLIVPVILLAGFFALSGMNKSSPVEAQRQAVVPGAILVVNEPSVRMWSGAIQFTDSNFADFRPHVQTTIKQVVVSQCMADEQVVPRRQSGCIQ